MAFRLMTVLCSLSITWVALLIVALLDKYYLHLPDTINLRACLPLTGFFTLFSYTLTGSYEYGRHRFHEIFYSSCCSTLLINLFSMTLPFFGILYFTSRFALLLNFAIQGSGILFWVYILHRLYFKIHPVISAIYIGDDAGDVLKINSHSRQFKINKAIPFDTKDLVKKIAPYDTVFLGNSSVENREQLISICTKLNKKIILKPSLYEIFVSNSSMIQFDDMMMFVAEPLGLSPEQRVAKRAFDIVASMLALILLSPLILVTSLVVFLSDFHAPFYRQERLTKGNRTFKIIKFRTMVPDAESKIGPTLSTADDPRVTKIGHFLRKTRIDEIPQFINVLKGEMSIVGPRPEREFFCSLYAEDIPEFSYRLAVKAGITGLAHVCGKYSTGPEDRLRLDLMYIKKYSFMLDLKIMMDTVRIMFSKDYAEGINSSLQVNETEERVVK